MFSYFPLPHPPLLVATNLMSFFVSLFLKCNWPTTQHSDSAFLYISKWSPWWIWLLSVTIKIYYIIIVSFLTVFPTLHTSQLWLINFVTGSLYLLISLTYFFSPPTHSPLATTYLFSVSMTPFLFSHVDLLCSSDSTREWNHTVFVFLCLNYFT